MGDIKWKKIKRKRDAHVLCFQPSSNAPIMIKGLMKILIVNKDIHTD
jgi:hypothetical protein